MKNKHVFMEEAGADAGGGASSPSNPPVDAPSQVPSDDWRSSLPPELQNSPSLQDVPDVATLVKNYESTKAMVGNSLRIPTEEAGAEDVAAFREKVLQGDHGLMVKPDTDNPESMQAFYKAIGRPDDAGDYTLPEGVNGEEYGALSSSAHALGLTDAQYAGMATALEKRQAAMMEQAEQERVRGIDQIKGELGPPAFDQRSERISAMVKAMGGFPGLEEAIANNGLNADAWRFLDAVSAQLGTENSQIATQIGQVTESTVDEIKQRIQERTKKMLTENLSASEHQDMIQRNVKDQERIASYRR